MSAVPRPLTIAGRQLESRLILGTGGFTNHQILAQALQASGAQLVTVALRRLDPDARSCSSCGSPFRTTLMPGSRRVSPRARTGPA